MEAAAHGESKHDVGPDRELTIIICSADEDREFTLAKTTKINDVIAAAVEAFGLDPNDAYDLFFPNQGGGGHDPGSNQNILLPKDRPLVSFDEIHDGTKLILTSRGGGV